MRSNDVMATVAWRRVNKNKHQLAVAVAAADGKVRRGRGEHFIDTTPGPPTSNTTMYL